MFQGERLTITCFASGTCLASGLSRLAAGLLARRFSHLLSSLRNDLAAQVILVQRSPSALKPCSQINGQTREIFCLIASSASTLATLASSLVRRTIELRKRTL